MGAKNTMGMTDVHRRYIVQQLAQYMSPTDTAKAVEKEFGIVFPRQAVERFDPTKATGRRLGKKWRELFLFTREAFLNDIVDRIPESNKSVRVQKLAKASRRFEEQGNYLGMAKMLELIAKETGDVFTNKRELTGKDGGPIKYQEVGDMTDEQILDELRSYGIDPEQIHAGTTTQQ